MVYIKQYLDFYSEHTLMILKLDNGDYGTIEFYTKNYREMSGLLVSPDPITRKQIRSIRFDY